MLFAYVDIIPGFNCVCFIDSVNRVELPFACPYVVLPELVALPEALSAVRRFPALTIACILLRLMPAVLSPITMFNMQRV